MKFLLRCSIFLCSCSQVLFSFAQGHYKGGKLYEQPPLTKFPKAGVYFFAKSADTALGNRLHQKVAQVCAGQNVTGITITALLPNKGMWRYDTGLISSSKNISVDSNSLFYWASAGKMITSIIIHQLILENKISLRDKLKKWYPQFQHADKITIHQLLHHTSGLYSFNSDTTFHYSNRYFTPDELLAVALKRNNYFLPGQYWSYSNTGYLLLALIAEKTEATSFPDIVKKRVTVPFHLQSLQALAPKEKPHHLALPQKNGNDVETDLSTPLGAGNIVSNSKDMAVLLSLLLTGKLLPLKTVHEMFTELYPMFQNSGQYYGAGIMLYNFNEINQQPNQWIGHSGGTENYKAVVAYDFATQSIVAVSVNMNIPAEAFANLIFRMIKEHS